MLPPSQTAAFASDHDAAILRCLAALLANNQEAPLAEPQVSRAHLSLFYGGMGLRSAARVRFAAYWGSWADSLPVLRSRLPGLSGQLLASLTADAPPHRTPCVQEVCIAADVLRQAGFQPPAWDRLAAGLRPQQLTERELGDPLRGWQREASTARDKQEFLTLFSNLDTASRALLLSQADPHGGRVLTTLPTAPELRADNPLFRVILLRRLRMPIPHGPTHCRCRRPMDTYGDHRAACPNAGVLKPRGIPLERAVARICREAGARVRENVLLADMNLDLPVADNRQIEVVANGLPLWHGAQLAVDATLVCPVGRDGRPRPRGDIIPGLALQEAARKKREDTYPEFLASNRSRLVVFGLEVGGRWDKEALDFLRGLARAKARALPQWLRASATLGFLHRWTALAAMAAQTAFAQSLLELPIGAGACLDGDCPPVHDVVADARWTFPVHDSRLPAA